MVRAIAPDSRLTFSQAQVAGFFFTAVVDENDEATGRWRCRICTREYRQEVGRGYSNLISHLTHRHEGYQDRLVAASVGETGSIGAWVSQRATVRYGHVDWIIEDGLPLHFCERPSTRRYSKLPPISYETLRDTVLRLSDAVEANIAAEVPAKFGIIFDGWSHDSEHFLAFFATYDVDGAVKTPLLSIAPIVNEPGDSHDVESHRLALESVLAVFGATMGQVAFLVGDNCSVNKMFARLVGVPLVGCSSHRLNLAVRVLTTALESELTQVQRLMVKLRGLNQAARLR